MSQSKTLGPTVAAGATLPVTGSNTFALVLAGLAVIVVGLLLMRLGRARENRP
jgi:LPXTG-motif cell wall-anchored protein